MSISHIHEQRKRGRERDTERDREMENIFFLGSRRWKVQIYQLYMSEYHHNQLISGPNMMDVDRKMLDFYL